MAQSQEGKLPRAVDGAHTVKKIAVSTILAVLMMTSLVFGQVHPSLLGTWSQSEPAGATWTFRSDGSGFMEHGDSHTVARFTWSSSDGVKLNVSTAGLSVPYTVQSNDGRALVLVNNRTSTTYRLVKK